MEADDDLSNILGKHKENTTEIKRLAPPCTNLLPGPNPNLQAKAVDKSSINPPPSLIQDKGPSMHNPKNFHASAISTLNRSQLVKGGNLVPQPAPSGMMAPPFGKPEQNHFENKIEKKFSEPKEKGGNPVPQPAPSRMMTPPFGKPEQNIFGSKIEKKISESKEKGGQVTNGIIPPDKISSINESYIIAPPNPKSKKMLNDSLTCFINILREHCNLQKLNEKTLQRKISGIQIVQLSDDLKCLKCKKLKLEITLSCFHKICMFCFVTSIETLSDIPKLQSARALSCAICKQNYSPDEIIQILGQERYLFLTNCQALQKKCYKCSINKSFLTDYFTELQCMHMCKSCYADELWSGIKKCMCCNLDFLNARTTLQRNAICANCGSEGNLVNEGYRALDSEHLLCYECLINSAEQMKCISCSRPCDRNYLRLMINKTCTVCKNAKTLSDLKQKKCCAFPVCYQCEESSSFCIACKRSYN